MVLHPRTLTKKLKKGTLITRTLVMALTTIIPKKVTQEIKKLLQMKNI
jgi:hypothetical protein